jgi:hypothetical protein
MLRGMQDFVKIAFIVAVNTLGDGLVHKTLYFLTNNNRS